jgi:hypothetical protein
MRIAARVVEWVACKRSGEETDPAGTGSNASPFWTLHEPNAYAANVVVRLLPAPGGTGRARASAANEGVGPVSDHPHDRLKSGGHHVSQRFLPRMSGCPAPLVLCRRSLGWRHLLRMQYNPQVGRELACLASDRMPRSPDAPGRFRPTARYSAAATSCGVSTERSRRNTGLTLGKTLGTYVRPCLLLPGELGCVPINKQRVDLLF